jgi:hypothetical protein
MKFKYLITIFILLSINSASAWVTDDISESGYYDYYSYGGEGIIIYWTDASTLPPAQLHTSMVVQCHCTANDRYAENKIEAVTSTQSSIEQYICTKPPDICDYYHTLENYLNYTGGATSGKQYKTRYIEYGDLAKINCISIAFHLWVDMDIFNATGDTCGLSYVDLYAWNGTVYNYIERDNLTVDNEYSFEIHNTTTYYLQFDNDHQYQFTCSEDIIYNYDACIQTWYHFKESCDNLIPDSEGFYIEKIGDTVQSADNFYTSSGILTISQSSADNIYVSANPFSGQIGWFLNPIVGNTTYTLTNPHIAWSVKVIVQNESDGSLIDGALVRIAQDCYCTDEHSIRQKLTVNGIVDFYDMSLQDASIFVTFDGYKTLNITNTSYSSNLSGRSNFSSKTWIVKLAPSWSDNESGWYEVSNKVNIHFRNEVGNRTSKIFDTDSEVYLYYENNNTNNSAMTLKFQSSSTHTHFIDVQSWNIPHNEIGHKTIINANFTPWDYSYRAVIYNSSIYGWNITIPLTVRNDTKEEEQHYENLSTTLWFMYASDGKIDYRDNMNIGVHACSNNTTLMIIDVELWKDGVYISCKNLTAPNFINADFPYYYVWNPVFDYISGSNYSIRMYGHDRTLLETDYVECYMDNVTRKNKLTIIVKNHYGTNLDNAFVFLEDYGSLSTGINYYNSYEGLDNGYYRFKATKPGYGGTGWDDITITDGDKIVTYVLTATDSDAGSATQPQKMEEKEMQNMYLIIMAFLLIFIIIGGLKYAL